jgi:hypothetical protein
MTLNRLFYFTSALTMALLYVPAATAQDTAAMGGNDGEARAYRQAIDDCAKHTGAARDACTKEAMDKFAKPMAARMPGSLVGNPAGAAGATSGSAPAATNR